MCSFRVILFFLSFSDPSAFFPSGEYPVIYQRGYIFFYPGLYRTAFGTACSGEGVGMSRIQSIIRECTEAFICRNCGMTVPPVLSGGKNRNHCPHCLYSRHEDILPGDRRSPCRGMMRPIAVWVKDNGEWYIVHRCEKCGTIRTNRIAADDDENVLLRLALKAVTNLPFPLEVCHEC